jgi:hypothetical protein
MFQALALGLAVTVGLAGGVEARMHHPYRGHRIVSAGAAPEFPLDAFATPTGAYSFRRLKTTYSGPAIRIRRASDNLEADINFLGFVPGLGSPWDEAAATSHCAATSCFATTVYDQSGAARHLTQTTAANQPALVFNCNGALPCLTVISPQLLTGPSLTPATGNQSISVVVNRSAGTGPCAYLRPHGTTGNRLVASNTVANSVTLAGATSGSFTATVADNAWHAVVAIVAGASPNSGVTIDGATTAGSAVGSITAGVTQFMAGSAATTCRWGETAFWDNYVLSAAEIAALTSNQRSFWGTP